MCQDCAGPEGAPGPASGRLFRLRRDGVSVPFSRRTSMLPSGSHLLTLSACLCLAAGCPEQTPAPSAQEVADRLKGDPEFLRALAGTSGLPGRDGDKGDKGDKGDTGPA